MFDPAMHEWQDKNENNTILITIFSLFFVVSFFFFTTSSKGLLSVDSMYDSKIYDTPIRMQISFAIFPHEQISSRILRLCQNNCSLSCFMTRTCTVSQI